MNDITILDYKTREMINNCPSLHFHKNEIIYHQGDSAENFYFLKNGRIKIFMLSPDGGEKTLNNVSAGELFGEGAFFDRKPRVSSALAVCDSEVSVVDRNALKNIFAENPEFAFTLLEILSNRIRLLSFQLDSMTFLSADKRVARILSQNISDSAVTMTHEEIAEAAGVSRVTVSKVLGKLSERKILSTEYRKIIINNYSALKKLSDNY